MIRIYAIIIAIILLLSSLGVSYWLYGKWRDAEKEKKSLVEFNSKSFKEVTYYKNKAGHEVAKNETLQLEYKTIKSLVKEGQLSTLKEFDGLKRNYRNLQSLIQTNMQLVGNMNLQVNKDSTFSFEDEYRNLIGRITHDSTGYVVHVADTSTIPLDVVIYWKRKWFLGKKTFRAEATSKNKNIKISGLESIQIREK